MAGFASAADVSVVEEIACKVNGDIITRTELEHDRKDAETVFRQQGLLGESVSSRPSVLSGRRTGLRDRIDRLLLIQKGKELDIKVDADLNKQLAEIQRKSNIADPEKFQQFVHDQLSEPF